MKAGYTHQVRIGHVYKEETDPFKVTGTARRGKVSPVELRRKDVQPFNGSYKFEGGFRSVFSAVRMEESGNPNPEGDKVKVYLYPAGIKGNAIVQGMIGLGYGNTFRKKQCPVLRQEEKPHCRKSAVSKSFPKPFFQEGCC
jgi:hypothetical protein